MKKYIVFVFFALFSIMFASITYASDVRVIVNNQEMTGLPTPPILRDARVLVPARAVFERLGAEVGWHDGNRQVSVFYGSNVLVMTINSNAATLNGTPITLPTPPILINGNTLIPLRPAELMGFYVNWDDSRRAAIVNSPIPTVPPPIINPPTIPPPTTAPSAEAPTIPAPTQPNTQSPQPPTAPSLGDDDVLHDRYEDDDTPVNQGLAQNISTTPIVARQYPKADITQVLTPSQTGMAAYTVVASSPISNVSYFVLGDNRLVVVMHNTVNLVNGNLAVHHSVPITGARITQYTTTPMVSRIVFDVVGAAQFSLSLSSNRHELTISFAKNNISSIVSNTITTTDTITIQGTQSPTVRISTEGYPNFLTILVDNATMNASGGIIANGTFATNFTTGQRINGPAYINIYMRDTWPSFNVAQNGNAVTLTLHHNLTGIRYDSLRRELIICRSTGFSMNTNQVQRIDNYLRLQYSLILPNAATMLGRGELGIMDGFINAVTLDTNSQGNAVLTFDTARILNFSVHETANSYIIRAHLPREVNPFIVVIDPGHGGTNPGSAHNGIREPELVLIIANKVMELLDANPNITVYMTRHDNTTTVPNRQRAYFANDIGADLFVSIHANAAEYSPGVINTTARGIETLYSLNNAGHPFTGRQFAEIVQRHMTTRTGAVSRNLIYRPNVVVFRYTTMPSVLVEVGFLTNPQEAALLTTAQYQWQLARAIYDAIVEAATRFPSQR